MWQIAEQTTQQNTGAITQAGTRAFEFLKYYQQARGLKDETIKTYVKALRHYHNFLQAEGLTADTATRHDLVQYKSSLDYHYTNKHTAKLYFTVVKCFYSFLAKEGYIADGSDRKAVCNKIFLLGIIIRIY